MNKQTGENQYHLTEEQQINTGFSVRRFVPPSEFHEAKTISSVGMNEYTAEQTYSDNIKKGDEFLLIDFVPNGFHRKHLKDDDQDLSSEKAMLIGLGDLLKIFEDEKFIEALSRAPYGLNWTNYYQAEFAVQKLNARYIVQKDENQGIIHQVAKNYADPLKQQYLVEIPLKELFGRKEELEKLYQKLGTRQNRRELRTAV